MSRFGTEAGLELDLHLYKTKSAIFRTGICPELGLVLVKNLD